MKKKIGTILAAVGLSLMMALTAAACTDKTTSKVFKSVSDVYGMGAVTTVSLLGSSFSAEAVQNFAAAAAKNTNEEVAADKDNTQKTEVDIEKFDKYFSMLDTLMGENAIVTELEENKDEAYAQYAQKLVITGYELSGEQVKHTMYYNETVVGQDAVKNANGSDSEDDTDEGDGANEGDGTDEGENADGEDSAEEKAEYMLEGVLVSGQSVSFMEGTRETQLEGDESEQEIEIRAYADIDNKDDYVQVKQEVSLETGEKEIEYVYGIYKGGDLIEQTSVEFEGETKQNKTVSELQIEFISGGSEGVYALKKEVKQNTTQIKVKYDVGGKKGKFIIMQKQNEKDKLVNAYSFEDGSETEIEQDD